MNFTTLSIRDVFDRDELSEMGHLVVANDVKRPDDVPISSSEQRINLGERILKQALPELGHHEHIRQSMIEWSSEVDGTDDDPGHYRDTVYKFSPQERNRGVLQDERFKKAKVVQAWAEWEFSEQFVKDCREQQKQDIREAWREEIEAAHDRRDLRLWIKDPPAEYNGWEKFEPEQDHVQVAYQAANHGVPSVVALFETEDGALNANEYMVEKWEDADGDPREAQWNRPVKRVASNTRVWEDLRDHLDTFDGEPLDETNRAAPEVSESA